ncbi:MAG TPA: zf-HC2 domain-containing protein, partial [Longimicrobiales bacterium]|nr:zf-HC2 domain-containing protein [Longimicrobiales bacterium]
MRWFKWHPDERLLNRFADGELGEREHARIAGHLAGCPPCREEVGLVRRIGDVARTLPGPIATDEVLRRALARRGAGERVLLPMSDAGATRPVPVRRFAPAAAAAVLTLLMVGLVFSVRVLEADRPALRIHPERPAAGEPLRVEYHGGALFADQTHLALRARYRTADDHHWQLLAGVLARGEDGLYRTEVQLPDSVVYAAFAVEDLHGERLDSNNRELWDVMAHGEDGKPTLDAMTARTWDLEHRDWGEAYEVAKEMTALYPDDPQSWSVRFAYELSLFDRDSIVRAHRREFARLERRISEAPGADPIAMAWLAIYAVDLSDFQTAELWLRRAAAEAPQSLPVAGAEALYLLVKQSDDLAATLPALENLWTRLSAGSRPVAHAGWLAALASQDPEAVLRWSARYLHQRPSEEVNLLADAVVAAELRPQLIRRVTAFLERPSRWHEGERALGLPIEAHVRSESRRFQRLLSESAVLAAESGDWHH